MDIVVLVFAISWKADVFEPPQQPTAVTAEIIRVNTETKDIYSDMWDPNWISKNENNLLQKTRP